MKVLLTNLSSNVINTKKLQWTAFGGNLKGFNVLVWLKLAVFIEQTGINGNIC